jgi:hypothetical protein
MKKRSAWFARSAAGRLLGPSSLTSFLFVVLLFLLLPQAGRAQAPPCPDPPSPISDSHTFHALGESITIPLSTAPCQTVAVTISWTNGPNNGSNLSVTFLDSSGQPIYSEGNVSAFNTGSYMFPSFSPYPYPWRGSRSALLNPASVKIETIYPFADPCDITYDITVTSRPGYNVGGTLSLMPRSLLRSPPRI